MPVEKNLLWYFVVSHCTQIGQKSVPHTKTGVQMKEREESYDKCCLSGALPLS